MEVFMKVFKKMLAVSLSLIMFLPFTTTIKLVSSVSASSNNLEFYDREKAVEYAKYFWDKVCSDGRFFYENNDVIVANPGDKLEELEEKYKTGGNDCAHFVSCCIGTPKMHNSIQGGGLYIPSRTAYLGAYGEPGALKLKDYLINEKLAVRKNNLSDLSEGDVIVVGKPYHAMIYMGDGKVSAHSQCLDEKSFSDTGFEKKEFIFFLNISCDDSSINPRTLSAPIPYAPPNESTQKQPISFKWNEVNGAEYYGLYIRDMVTNVLVYDSEIHESSGKIYSTNHTPLVKYVEGHEYRWNMRAGTKETWSENFSKPWYFTIDKPDNQNTAPTSAPSTLSPSNGSTVSPGPVTFRWSSVSTATYYQFELYNGNSRVLNGDNRSTSCSVELGKNRESLKWRVRACNDYGCGPWSSFAYFTNRGS